MRSNRHWIAAALIAALLLVSASAQAVVIKGRGELAAAGNGLAVLEMRGQATVRGGGLLIVEDDAIVETRGVGRVTELGDGRVLFEGFGQVTVRSGDPMRIEAGGAKLRIRARGIGVAFLKGCGHFVAGDADGAWEPDLSVEFESDE